MESSKVYEIFNIADKISTGKYNGFLNGKSVILYFPVSSIRTRVTFEKGIYLLGGQPILFPNDSLEKREDLEDVCGYLNNWADIVIVRHRDIQLIEKFAEYSKTPVINAMKELLLCYKGIKLLFSRCKRVRQLPVCAGVRESRKSELGGK